MRIWTTRRWKNGAREPSSCGALCARMLSGGAGILDPAAIATVAAESWPDVRDADELHDALLSLITLPPGGAWGDEWREFFMQLTVTGRASVIERDGKRFWVATERLHLIGDVLADACAAGWNRSGR